MSSTLFKLPPSKVAKELALALECNLTPMLTSSPGLGKSSIIKQLAKEYRLEVIDLRLSQCAPEDLMGLPMKVKTEDGMKATFAPFTMFPTESTPLPKGKEGWLLFLDEFNSAAKSVQAAAYKLVLDHEVGQAKLHPRVFKICAGNLATDGAIVNQQSTAMQSRLVHLEMEANLNDFIRYANKNKWDSRLIAFLQFRPGLLHDFKPDHTNKTFACPRTWEFANRIISGRKAEDISMTLLAGALSDGVATEFHTFLLEFDRLPALSSILADPMTAIVPTEMSTRYATTCMVTDATDQQNFATIAKYLGRMKPEFQCIFFRGIYQRNKKMRELPAFNSAMTDLLRFLNDDQREMLKTA